MEQPNTWFDYDNESEVKTLFLRVYPRLLSYARNILGQVSSLAAEDVVSDVFCKFLNKRTALSPFATESYLYTMVRNASLNLLKKAKAENRISLEELSALQSMDFLATVDFLSGPPEKKLREMVIEEVLSFCVELPPRTGEVFRLSRIEGMTGAEIAAHLGISQRAVEKHISISITRYREAFLQKRRTPDEGVLLLILSPVLRLMVG